MSLNYDTSKCNPPLPRDEQESTNRDILLQLTIPVGIDKITTATVPEFYARVHMLELLHGTFRLSHAQEPPYFTRADIERWIGATTNASTMTRAQFLKTISRAMDRWTK